MILGISSGQSVQAGGGLGGGNAMFDSCDTTARASNAAGMSSTRTRASFIAQHATDGLAEKLWSESVNPPLLDQSNFLSHKITP